MEALFGRGGDRLRTDRDAVTFALDLTAEAVTLHERAPQGGWKKFASARLDDPEFPVVIGLLRTEAEAQAGGRGPVCLWLPGEQVLSKRARLGDVAPAARLRAAFDYVDRETVYRPEDVAVAVAPANGADDTALLITFAETWREARAYAARWGFIPGPVSTRHHAGDFGPEGPVFRLQSQPPEPSARPSATGRRRRLAGTALALAAVAAGAAAWSLRPWEGLPGRAGTAVAVSEAPEPATLIEVPPPERRPGIPLPMRPGSADWRPRLGAAPEAPGTPAAPDTPAALVAAPGAPPDLGSAPPGRDPVAAWTGPVPVLEPPALPVPPVRQAISGPMDPPARAETVSLLAASGSPPRAPPVVEPPPAEPAATPPNDAPPVEVAEVLLPVPIPVPRPARPGPETRPEAAAPTAPDDTAAAAPAAPETEPEDPDAPTEFASLKSPLPRPRPDPPPLPSALPSAATLPALSGAAQRAARAAATERGLPLDRIALIGILNLDSGRKALLRLPNGRYRSVVVGDDLDGWRVSMIGADAMRISRDGEDRTFLLINR